MAGILQHRGVGKRERTKSKYLCKLAPGSCNLHDPPFTLHNAREIPSLPSKAADSFRRMTRVISHLRALLSGTADVVNKERGPLPKGNCRKEGETHKHFHM